MKKRRFLPRQSDRNYNDPAYKAWRLAVYRRDKWTCRWPGCTNKTKLQAHHIKPWSIFPSLRFELKNGITLCKLHHDRVKGREEELQIFFYRILGLIKCV